MSMHPLSKLVWAIDPFFEDESLQKTTVQFIKSINKGNKISIDPVSIVESDAQAEALENLTRFLKKTKVSGLTDAEVLVQSDRSLTKAVLRLVAYAKQVGAAAIVVSTQASRGATRFLLGSFAETLILESDVPVLAISPKSKLGNKLKTILYPTDFSERSHEVFPQVLSVASVVGAKVVLFHRRENPLESDERSQPFAALAQKARVPFKSFYSEKEVSTAKAILDGIRHTNANLVAMVSYGAPSPARVVVGSTTRQVLRAADCPVWIIHPK